MKNYFSRECLVEMSMKEKRLGLDILTRTIPSKLKSNWNRRFRSGFTKNKLRTKVVNQKLVRFGLESVILFYKFLFLKTYSPWPQQLEVCKAQLVLGQRSKYLNLPYILIWIIESYDFLFIVTLDRTICFAHLRPRNDSQRIKIE